MDRKGIVKDTEAYARILDSTTRIVGRKKVVIRNKRDRRRVKS